MRRLGWPGVALGIVVAFLLSLVVQWFYQAFAFDGGERGTFVSSSDSQMLALSVEITGVAVA